MIGTQLDKVFGCQHWDVEHQAGLLRAQVTRLSPDVAELVYASDDEARSESSINSEASAQVPSSNTMVPSSMAPMNNQPLGTRSLDTIALLALDDMIVASRNEDVLEERPRSLRPSAGLLSQNLEDATRPSSPSTADFEVRRLDFR